MLDALVIGGSFAGLSAAMQLARARRRVTVVDAGEPRNRFAATSHGFFGQDGVPPREMIAAAREKLLAYPTVSVVSARAVVAQAEEGGFTVALDDGASLAARMLLLATGVRDVLPPIGGLVERWGVSVLHCPYCHGHEHADQRLGVLGAGPMAVMKAILIADWGPVTLFLDGPDTLEPEDQARLAARGISVVPGRVAAVEGPDRTMTTVVLDGGHRVPTEALFVAPSVHMTNDLAASLGCAFDDGPFGPVLRTDASKMTTVKGVFAAGDAATPMHNATLASADGVLAGTGLHRGLVFGV